ncbi:MAG TPA: hypothetical protein VGL53_10340 [Bryobacteraceae bacterium]
MERAGIVPRRKASDLGLINRWSRSSTVVGYHPDTTRGGGQAAAIAAAALERGTGLTESMRT